MYHAHTNFRQGQPNSRSRSPTSQSVPDNLFDDFSNNVENAPEADHPDRYSDAKDTIPAPEYSEKIYHQKLNAIRCDKDGEFSSEALPAESEKDSDDWSPFQSRVEFKLANFLYRKVQMSQGNIDELLDYWAETLFPYDANAPFADHRELLELIDKIEQGDAPWQSFSVSYTGAVPDIPNPPSWMTQEYEVWYRDPRTVAHNMLGNPTFKDKIDYVPYREYDGTGKQRLQNFMSANWSERKANELAEDESMHGGMFVPIILGSDKTTVSVATGQNEYYPLYMSLGNFHNDARRAHCDAVIPIGFLAIPKGERKHDNDKTFRTFRRQLFHSSISAIFQTVKPYMSEPDIVICPDGYYRRAIYGFGPYIADYPEQVLLTLVVQGWCPRCLAPHNNLDGERCGLRRSREHRAYLLQGEFSPRILWDDYGYVSDVVPFTDGFPNADIHELIAPDLLHQVIKGTFKDHLVEWVVQYLKNVHGQARADQIVDDIDRRIAAVPHFSGLRRFPQGRRFKQWTGDDSKALMKVFLPAISGHVPDKMVRCIASFLDFCYLARRDVFNNDILDQMDQALHDFHQNRSIFIESGVRPGGVSLPRQHSLVHYRLLIEEFGAPNGLCSSITEAKHIRAVKQPWRRSSRFEAVGQMLVINQRQDKLSAAHADFEARGMLRRTDADVLEINRAILEEQVRQACIADNGDDEEPDDSPKDILGETFLAKTPARGYPSRINQLSQHMGKPQLTHIVGHYLYQQQHPDDERALEEVPPQELPSVVDLRFHVFHSAVARFYSPSDIHGINGMHRERIRAVPTWRKGPACDYYAVCCVSALFVECSKSSICRLTVSELSSPATMYDDDNGDSDVVYTLDPEEVELVDLLADPSRRTLVGPPGSNLKLKSCRSTLRKPRLWVKEEPVAHTGILSPSRDRDLDSATLPSSPFGATLAVHSECKSQSQSLKPHELVVGTPNNVRSSSDSEFPPHFPPLQVDSTWSPEPPNNESSGPTGPVDADVVANRPLHRRDPNRWIRIFIDPFDPQPDDASNSLWLPSLRDPSIPPGVRVPWRASTQIAHIVENNTENDENDKEDRAAAHTTAPPPFV
ncbi:hypothetical protein K474DRAFT_1677225 [Panus rudis PR-1116 ss-1]|nr:hypothetical protein K474DRAFT_1677225 [Panus rudis PR-1116 ss-1]